MEATNTPLEAAQAPAAQTITGSLAHLRDTARRAHAWISMNPDRAADHVIRDGESDLRDFLYAIPRQHHEWAKEKYIRFFTKWLHAKGRCISPMITGPSNFPVKKAQKYNNWEQGTWNEFRKWRDGIIERLNRQERRKLTLDDEYIATENLLAEMKEAQEQMKACNKVVNAKKLSEEEKLEELEHLGIETAQARKLLAGDYIGRTGFRAFELTNNNARIKHHEDKLLQLEKRINAREVEAKETVFEGGRIVENIEADRLQIIFDGIPAADIRNELKSNGFKWAPSNGCWQTFLRSGKYKLPYLKFLKNAKTDAV